jgi:UDP-glucose:(heptosyl)LPS alpha-1,3-glucosyltransferase
LKFAFIIFKYFPFGGMQRDMLRTANELTKRGHQVEIFTLSWQGQLPDENSPENIKVHVLPQKGWFNFTRYQQFIDATFAHINAQEFDLVFGYNRMANLDAHFAADPCFVERAAKQRHWLYRLTPRYKWFAACEKAIFAKESATEILAVSLTEKPHFQSWYGTQNERFHFIPPFLSPERFQLEDKTAMRKYMREAFGFAENDFIYLLTGSGFAMKGLDRAILALADMPKHLRANTKLVAVGQDNPKQFLKLAQKLGVADHVVISKGRPDTPKLMQGADVCVHPAYRENTGLVILEGMACGAPMLVTETCGYAHFVAESRAGLVNEAPFNQMNFSAQWTMMRQADEEQLQKWSANGLKKAQEIMLANDGSAEAKILIKLAETKKQKAVKRVE